MAFASAHPKRSITQKSSAAVLNVLASLLMYRNHKTCCTFRSHLAHVNYWQKIRQQLS